MSSVIALNQIDGSELWKKVGFKHSEKVLVALRGVYNLPFNLDDPVDAIRRCNNCSMQFRGHMKVSKALFSPKISCFLVLIFKTYSII